MDVPPRSAKPDTIPAVHDPIRDALALLGGELRGPVHALRRSVDALLDDPVHPVSPAQRGQIDGLVETCDGLDRLTRDYFDYARRSRGLDGVGAPDCFRMGDLLREIDDRFASIALGRKIAWSSSMEGPDAIVRSDRAACLRIIEEVVSNAVEYAAEGGSVRLVVSSVGEGPGDWSAIVTDDGPGIPEGDRVRVFEPFHRLDREARSGVDANGLGLAISRALARGLGGDVLVDPSVAEGTRVVIRLPGLVVEGR